MVKVLLCHMTMLAATAILATSCGPSTGTDSLSARQAQGASTFLGCTEKCHNDSSTISPDPLVTNGSGSAGKHMKHVQERGLFCEVCHSGYYSTPTHMNGVLDTGNQIVNMVSLDIVGPAGSWVNATGLCSGMACHGTAILEWYGTNTWTTPACSTCHISGFSPALDPAVTNGTPPAGRHEKHVTTRDLACERCHDQYPARLTHMNGRMDAADPAANLMQFTIVATTGSWANDSGAMTGQCADISCHGTDALSWYGNSTWTLPAACTTCHAATYASELDPLVTNGSGTTGKHTKHVTSYNYDCRICHQNYPNRPSHANGILDVRDPSAPLIWFGVTNPTGTWVNDTGPGTGACSSLSCHGAYSGTYTYWRLIGDDDWEEVSVNYSGVGDTMPDWYSPPGTLGCSACHGNPPQGTGTWHTLFHGGGSDCQLCHADATGSGGVGVAITDTSLHANGALNVQPRWTSSCIGCH